MKARIMYLGGLQPIVVTMTIQPYEAKDILVQLAKSGSPPPEFPAEFIEMLEAVWHCSIKKEDEFNTSGRHSSPGCGMQVAKPLTNLQDGGGNGERSGHPTA